MVCDPGGSREYIAPLVAQFKDNIVLNAQIKHVNRDAEGVTVCHDNGEQQRFDKVVFACHSDQALALLAEPSQAEQDILGAIPYTANSVVLHTDTSLLPKRKLAWASWNYLLNEATDKAAVVTYQMNILQGLNAKHDYCVTLNHDEGIAENKVIKRFTYHHPVFNTTSIAAQKRKDELDGEQHSYFCGAYWFNGFHEDGVKSAVDVAEKTRGSVLNSALLVGKVRHRRYSHAPHQFSYPMYMMWADLAELDKLNDISPWLGTEGIKPLIFNQSDYIKGLPGDLHSRALAKVQSLGLNSVGKLM